MGFKVQVTDLGCRSSWGLEVYGWVWGVKFRMAAWDGVSGSATCGCLDGVGFEAFSLLMNCLAKKWLLHLSLIVNSCSWSWVNFWDSGI